MLLYLEDLIGGDFIEVTFDNAIGGGPDGLSERLRGVEFLEAVGCE